MKIPCHFPKQSRTRLILSPQTGLPGSLPSRQRPRMFRSQTRPIFRRQCSVFSFPEERRKINFIFDFNFLTIRDDNHDDDTTMITSQSKSSSAQTPVQEARVFDFRFFVYPAGGTKNNAPILINLVN